MLMESTKIQILIKKQIHSGQVFGSAWNALIFFSSIEYSNYYQ